MRAPGKVCTFVFYAAARHGFAVRTHPGFAEDAAKQSFDEARRFLARHLPVTGYGARMATDRRQQIRLSPDEQAVFFRERKKAALATIDKDGFPHVVAMNYFARDGAFYMTSYGKAQKVVNIRRNPKVALMIEAGDGYAELRGVMVRGRCEVLEDETSVRAAFEARAGAQASAPPVQPGAPGQRAEARGPQDRSGEGGRLGPPQARRTLLTGRREGERTGDREEALRIIIGICNRSGSKV